MVHQHCTSTKMILSEGHVALHQNLPCLFPCKISLGKHARLNEVVHAVVRPRHTRRIDQSHRRTQLCAQQLEDGPLASSGASSEHSVFNTGDVLLALSADLGEAHLEVLHVKDAGTCTVAWQGLLVQVSKTSDGFTLQQAGPYPLSNDATLWRHFPGWQACCSSAPRPSLPSPQVAIPAASLTRVSSLSQLQQQVQAHPSPWCDGTGPNDPPVVGTDYQLLCAGELMALLLGFRGVAMVQLHVGWDASTPQPVFNPLVITLLRRCAQHPDIGVVMSPAMGGLGLTAILHANKEPFKSWAGHLASFGAQAAVVAESPYYKLLVGRILGFKEENIIHHIKAFNGPLQPTAEVVAAVKQQLNKLSGKKGGLPWNVSSRRKKASK